MNKTLLQLSKRHPISEQNPSEDIKISLTKDNYKNISKSIKDFHHDLLKTSPYYQKLLHQIISEKGFPTLSLQDSGHFKTPSGTSFFHGIGACQSHNDPIIALNVPQAALTALKQKEKTVENTLKSVFVFEMCNLARHNAFDTLQRAAKEGHLTAHFAHTPPLSCTATSTAQQRTMHLLARHPLDHAATHYARLIEDLEYDSLRDCQKILAEHQHNSGAHQPVLIHQNPFLSDDTTRDQSLRQQIILRHTQNYLRQYDNISPKNKSQPRMEPISKLITSIDKNQKLTDTQKIEEKLRIINVMNPDYSFHRTLVLRHVAQENFIQHIAANAQTASAFIYDKHSQDLTIARYASIQASRALVQRVAPDATEEMEAVLHSLFPAEEHLPQ